jgi:hypothetical protein
MRLIWKSAGSRGLTYVQDASGTREQAVGPAASGMKFDRLRDKENHRPCVHAQIPRGFVLNCIYWSMVCSSMRHITVRWFREGMT